MSDEELAKEAARWTGRSDDGRTWVDAPERVPRSGESTPISVRLPKRQLAILREFARRKSVGYQVLMKRWLEDRIRAEFDRMRAIGGASVAREAEASYSVSPPTEVGGASVAREAEAVYSVSPPTMELRVGATAPFSDGKGAFAHLSVVNRGPFAPRVQCSIRFERLDGSRLFPNEMPARWSCAPEPIRQHVIARENRLDIVFIPDPSLLPVQSVADFATHEEHAIAVAVRHSDGSCWGFTPQSYFHQFRAPEWRLPNESLRVVARLLVSGREVSKQFELDCSAPPERFGLTSSEKVSGVEFPIAEAVPTLPSRLH